MTTKLIGFIIKNYRFYLIVILFCSFLNTAYCADNYQVGDKLYVWAKNGLNIRKGHSSKSSRLGTISFGDSVRVVEKTQYNYNAIGVTNSDRSQNLDNIILYGNWVKVENSNGQIGYVIDQYLIRIRPYLPAKELNSSLYLKELNRDTLFCRVPFRDGESLNIRTEVAYEFGVTNLIESGGVWNSNVTTFPNFTIEEVLILMSFDEEESDFRIITNWPNKIEFHDDGLCSIKIEKIDNEVIVTVFCSC